MSSLWPNRIPRRNRTVFETLWIDDEEQAPKPLQSQRTGATDFTYPLDRLLDYSPASAQKRVSKFHRKFPDLGNPEIIDLIERFNKIQTETPGRITQDEAINAIIASGEASYDLSREIMKDVQLDASGKVEVDDWVELIFKIRLARARTPIIPTATGQVTVRGSNANASHVIDEDERVGFTNHINAVLGGDPDLGFRLPIPTDSMRLFDECRDGIILCKLLAQAVPGSLDTRFLKVPKGRSLNRFQVLENIELFLVAARNLDFPLINIGGGDIADGREHLVIGLIWQIIRRGLLAPVEAAKTNPELSKLCEPGETQESLARLTPEQILLRWFNFHLKAAGWKRSVTSFTQDLRDGENYTVLLHRLKPHESPLHPLSTRDLEERVEQVLVNADRIGCRKFLNARSMLLGNPRLNIAFVANLFNTHSGLTITPPKPKAIATTTPITVSTTVNHPQMKPSKPLVSTPVADRAPKANIPAVTPNYSNPQSYNLARTREEPSNHLAKETRSRYAQHSSSDSVNSFDSQHKVATPRTYTISTPVTRHFTGGTFAREALKAFRASQQAPPPPVPPIPSPQTPAPAPPPASRPNLRPTHSLSMSRYGKLPGARQGTLPTVTRQTSILSAARVSPANEKSPSTVQQQAEAPGRPVSAPVPPRVEPMGNNELGHKRNNSLGLNLTHSGRPTTRFTRDISPMPSPIQSGRLPAQHDESSDPDSEISGESIYGSTVEDLLDELDSELKPPATQTNRELSKSKVQQPVAVEDVVDTIWASTIGKAADVAAVSWTPEIVTVTRPPQVVEVASVVEPAEVTPVEVDVPRFTFARVNRPNEFQSKPTQVPQILLHTATGPDGSRKQTPIPMTPTVKASRTPPLPSTLSSSSLPLKSTAPVRDNTPPPPSLPSFAIIPATPSPIATIPVAIQPSPRPTLSLLIDPVQVAPPEAEPFEAPQPQIVTIDHRDAVPPYRPQSTKPPIMAQGTGSSSFTGGFVVGTNTTTEGNSTRRQSFDSVTAVDETFEDDARIKSFIAIAEAVIPTLEDNGVIHDSPVSLQALDINPDTLAQEWETPPPPPPPPSAAELRKATRQATMSQDPSPSRPVRESTVTADVIKASRNPAARSLASVVGKELKFALRPTNSIGGRGLSKLLSLDTGTVPSTSHLRTAATAVPEAPRIPQPQLGELLQAQPTGHGFQLRPVHRPPTPPRLDAPQPQPGEILQPQTTGHGFQLRPVHRPPSPPRIDAPQPQLGEILQPQTTGHGFQLRPIHRPPTPPRIDEPQPQLGEILQPQATGHGFQLRPVHRPPTPPRLEEPALSNFQSSLRSVNNPSSASGGGILQPQATGYGFQLRPVYRPPTPPRLDEPTTPSSLRAANNSSSASEENSQVSTMQSDQPTTSKPPPSFRDSTYGKKRAPSPVNRTRLPSLSRNSTPFGIRSFPTVRSWLPTTLKPQESTLPNESAPASSPNHPRVPTPVETRATPEPSQTQIETPAPPPSASHSTLTPITAPTPIRPIFPTELLEEHRASLRNDLAGHIKDDKNSSEDGGLPRVLRMTTWTIPKRFRPKNGNDGF